MCVLRELGSVVNLTCDSVGWKLACSTNSIDQDLRRDIKEKIRIDLDIKLTLWSDLRQVRE